MTAGKGIAALVLAGAAWMTGTLGEAWIVLLVLLAVDAVLNYRQEAAWLQRVLAFLLATGVAAYLQAGAGVPGLRAVVIACVAWEAVRVADELMAWYTAYRARNPKDTTLPATQDVAAALAALTTRVEAMAKLMPTNPPVAPAGTAAADKRGP